MTAFRLRILAANRVFYDGECFSLQLPAKDGFIGIQANHVNMLSALVPGMLSILTADNARRYAAVSQGLVKIENGDVLILAETVESPEEIDAVRAERAAAEAKEAMLQKKSMRSYHESKVRLAREINRLKVKKSINI